MTLRQPKVANKQRDNILLNGLEKIQPGEEGLMGMGSWAHQCWRVMNLYGQNSRPPSIWIKNQSMEVDANQARLYRSYSSSHN